MIVYLIKIIKTNKLKIMELNKRKSVFDSMEKYCVLSKKDDVVEVTEWSNGEGFDISFISEKGDKSISLTYGEIDAIYYLTKTLDYSERGEEE